MAASLLQLKTDSLVRFAKIRRLYEKLGATIYDDNCFCKLSGEALERLAS